MLSTFLGQPSGDHAQTASHEDPSGDFLDHHETDHHKTE